MDKSTIAQDDATVQQDNERFHQLYNNSGTIDMTYNETLTLTIKKLSLNDLMRLCSQNCIYIDLNNSPSASKGMQSKFSDSITSQSSQSDESDWTLHVSTTSEEEDRGSPIPHSSIWNIMSRARYNLKSMIQNETKIKPKRKLNEVNYIERQPKKKTTRLQPSQP